MITKDFITCEVALNCNEARSIYNSSFESGHTKFSTTESEDYKKNLLVL